MNPSWWELQDKTDSPVESMALSAQGMLSWSTLSIFNCCGDRCFSSELKPSLSNLQDNTWSRIARERLTLPDFKIFFSRIRYYQLDLTSTDTRLTRYFATSSDQQASLWTEINRKLRISFNGKHDNLKNWELYQGCFWHWIWLIR